jgi:ABC-type sugar transport system ATPase subunit
MNDIVLKDIGFQYQDKKIFADFSCSFDREKIYVILGPSGTGKTTLLKIISGLLIPDSGTVTIDGKDVTGSGAEDRNIAFSFQDSGLFPNQSLYENVLFSLQKEKWSWEEKDRKAKDILNRFGLAPFSNAKPKYLSFGECQRASIAKCLVKKSASVCLMDEPLSSLDALKRQRFIVFLKKLHAKRNAPLIAVMHDQVDAFSLADELLILDKGQIVQQGKPQSIYEKPKNIQVASLLMDGLTRIECNIQPSEKSSIGLSSSCSYTGLKSNERFKGIGKKSFTLAMAKENWHFKEKAGDFSLKACFKEKESLGNNSSVYLFAFGPSEISVVAGDEYEFKERQETMLFAPADKALYFDSLTGENLER